MVSKLIFLGDTHGFIDDFIKQKEVIEQIRPEFVLAEQLENKTLNSEEEYAEFIKYKTHSSMTSFEEVEKLIKICKEKNIKLIGIDLENFGFDERLQKVVKGIIEPSKEDEEKIELLLEKRDKLHIEKIREYSAKTKKPILIILGSWHLREGSPLLKEFKNYALIVPVNSKEEILFSPPKKDEKISYRKI